MHSSPQSFRHLVHAFVLTIIGLLLVPSRPSSAQTDVTPLDLARNASVIVEGTVTALRGAWDARHQKIYTSLTLQVARVPKGSVANGAMQIRFLGGTVDDITLVIDHQPQFAQDERVLLFLMPNYEAREFPIVMQGFGKFTIETDPTTGAEILVSEMGRFQRSTIEDAIQIEESPVR